MPMQMQMPMPVTAQYGSLHVPEGYIPPTVNPPVVPQDVISPRPDPDYWKRAGQSQQHQRHPSQSHHRRPSQSHPPIMSVNPPVMPVPRPFSEPTSTTVTSTLASPPFKPFQPLPVIERAKPPTPPPKLLDITPYRETLSYLSRPTEACRTKALEILQNKDLTDVERAHEEWRKQDEEREKFIREKKEERRRLVDGASTIRAPTMQTVTALVVDPTTMQQPPPPPKKDKRPLWRKLFRSGKSDHNKRQLDAQQSAQASGPVIIPIGPQQVLPSLPSVPGVVVPMQMPSSSRSSSSRTHDSPGRFAQPTSTPAVIPVTPGRTYGRAMPSPAGRPVGMPSPSHHLPRRSTTPDVSPPPTAAFYSIPNPVHV